jgi:hypothetical protein
MFTNSEMYLENHFPKVNPKSLQSYPNLVRLTGNHLYLSPRIKQCANELKLDKLNQERPFSGNVPIVSKR